MTPTCDDSPREFKSWQARNEWEMHLGGTGLGPVVGQAARRSQVVFIGAFMLVVSGAGAVLVAVQAIQMYVGTRDASTGHVLFAAVVGAACFGMLITLAFWYPRLLSPTKPE